MPDYAQDLVEKYKAKLRQSLNLPDLSETKITSKEYQDFKKESMPKALSLYESVCKFCGKILSIKLKPEKDKALRDAIGVSHLDITPAGAVAFSVIVPICILLFGIAFSLLVLDSLFFTIFFSTIGLTLLSVFSNLPYFIANSWRMKASNQMVLCIFYIVTYMRHTSNLERAISFASEHLTPPLGLDMKKIIWDVETQKFKSVKESVDAYLLSWREFNKEFVEAFHLIESSLYEGSEERRVSLLDKGLEVILEQTYEKMLHYAQNLKAPITTLHMLGVVLPILGLVILPLIVSFMGEVSWIHIAALYNIGLPIIVYSISRNILSKRPTGYGDADISDLNPELKKYKNLTVKFGKRLVVVPTGLITGIVGFLLFLVALSPMIVHKISPDFDFCITSDFEIGCPSIDASEGKKGVSALYLLNYRQSDASKELVGPFGLGAAILSVFFVLALAYGIGLYFKLRSKSIIEIRDKTRKLEDEFSSALFQLGNRLADGIPAEIALEKVGVDMEETVSGEFFMIAASNIRRLGMGLREAIFSPKVGAIVYFPSAVIQSSMKVFTEGIKKGPKIASQALLNISRYIKEIHRVNERLKDLLADIIADIKSQINFLTPVIAGIVIGITSMITYIIGELSVQIKSVKGGGAVPSGFLGQMDALGIGDTIPTYYFQLVVGVYVFQIIYILTIMENGIENGQDKLQEQFSLGKNLLKGSIMYAVLSVIIMIVFNLIALQILKLN